MSREAFVEAYGDAVYLSELHRGRPEDVRRAVDSMLRAHGSDTAAFLSSARWYSAREDELDSVYAALVRRLELKARGGSAR